MRFSAATAGCKCCFARTPESIRARTIADTERLNNRTLTVMLEEIQNPNVALRVTDFAMKDGQEKSPFCSFCKMMR
ncbi:Uncharacterised protein [Raoultella terrigena]|uniref:Uncharacterized protein n=1 Tax=Raoultella terrigena TaxID=577 RepID=A0A4U9DCB8_RAOTE|nr:Uncharacterised protein [Raoultella terrigena]